MVINGCVKSLNLLFKYKSCILEYLAIHKSRNNSTWQNNTGWGIMFYDFFINHFHAFTRRGKHVSGTLRVSLGALSRARVARSLIFSVMFCWSLFALLSFFFRSLYCLSFDLRLLTTPLVSPSLSLIHMHCFSLHSEAELYQAKPHF